MIYRLLIVLGLSLVAVAMWLTLSPRVLAPSVSQASAQSEPDLGYSAVNARVVETGVDGLPQYTLQARQVQQEADSNIIDLTAVQMTFRDSRGEQWHASSNHATATQDSAQIELFGNVDVTGMFAGRPLTLLTDTLHVDTRSEVIRTRAAVSINWVGKLTALGLVADLEGQHLKLESQVHGRYVP